MKVRDPRLLAIKALISLNQITSFRQIFEHISKSAIADYLRTSYNRVDRITREPETAPLHFYFKMAALLEVPERDIMALVLNDLKGKKITRKMKGKLVG